MRVGIPIPVTRTSNSDTVQLDQINYISVNPGQHFQKTYSSIFEVICALGSSNPTEM